MQEKIKKLCYIFTTSIKRLTQTIFQTIHLQTQTSV